MTGAFQFLKLDFIIIYNDMNQNVKDLLLYVQTAKFSPLSTTCFEKEAFSVISICIG